MIRQLKDVPSLKIIEGGQSEGGCAGFVRPDPRGETFKCVVSWGGGWEHVSISHPRRCPTWDEMDGIKRLFWPDEDAVMQLHPPRIQWVNNVSTCLHMWRPTEVDIPLPPQSYVGIPELGVLS